MRFSAVASLALCSIQVAFSQSEFHIPSWPCTSAAQLDAAPVAFSYPFATLQGYFPGAGLTTKCMSTFKSLNGVWPRIRIGGTSEDYGIFDPDLDVPNIVTGTAPTGQSTTIFGPKLMRLIKDYKGTIVWGANRGANNITNTMEAAKAAVREIPTLYAIELGNEPTPSTDAIVNLHEPVFGGIGLPIASTVPEWTPETETESELEWQLAIGDAIGRKEIFQAGSYYQPPSRGWSAQSFFRYANDSAKPYIKVFSHHNYPQSAISSQQDPPNVKYLMSHMNVTSNVGQYKSDVAAARSAGFDYVFGETNSVSGNGQPGQGATFGTGLWVLDYALQSASVNIKRNYFHQGTPGHSYYVWFNDTGIKSPFYGGYVAAEALAGGAAISSLDNGTTNYAGYAVFNHSGEVTKVVLINTDFYNGTGTRPTRHFILEGLVGSRVTAKRLTARSTLSQQDLGEAVTYAGQTISDTTCQPIGKEVLESAFISNTKAIFTVAASEALVIRVHKRDQV